MPRLAFLLGSDAIFPVVCGAKVPARISHDRDLQFLQSLDDILTKPIIVRQSVTGIVDPAVDAAPNVSRNSDQYYEDKWPRRSWVNVGRILLYEPAVDIGVDFVQFTLKIDSDCRGLVR